MTMRIKLKCMGAQNIFIGGPNSLFFHWWVFFISFIVPGGRSPCLELFANALIIVVSCFVPLVLEPNQTNGGGKCQLVLVRFLVCQMVDNDSFGFVCLCWSIQAKLFIFASLVCMVAKALQWNPMFWRGKIDSLCCIPCLDLQVVDKDSLFHACVEAWWQVMAFFVLCSF